MKRTQILVKIVYVSVSVLKSMSFGMIVKRKHRQKPKLCYMNKDRFKIYIKTEAI